MKIKSIIDDALDRGEKIKEDVLNELFKSRTIQDLVSNTHFVKAISRVIETKEEISRSLNKQIKSIFQAMDVPTKADLKKIGRELTKLEKLIDKVGGKKISVKTLPKTKKTTGKKTKTKSKVKSKKKTGGKKLAKKTKKVSSKKVKAKISKKKTTKKKTAKKKTK